MQNATDPYNRKAFTPEERQIIGLLDERAHLAVFRLLRFYELVDYYPLFVERDNEYDILRSCVRDETTAELLLWYFRQAESRAALCDGILSGGEPPTVLFDELRTIAEKHGRTPLMAELPEQLAFDIWRQCGTWTGALQLAGMTALDNDARGMAREKYRYANASPKLIRGKYHDLMVTTLLGFEAVEAVCAYAHEKTRKSLRNSIPYSLYRAFESIFGDEYLGMMYLGIKLYVKPLPSKLKGTGPAAPAHQTLTKKQVRKRRLTAAQKAQKKEQIAEDKLHWHENLERIFKRIGVSRVCTDEPLDTEYAHMVLFSAKYDLAHSRDAGETVQTPASFQAILTELDKALFPYLNGYIILPDGKHDMDKLAAQIGRNDDSGDGGVTYYGALLYTEHNKV